MDTDDTIRHAIFVPFSSKISGQIRFLLQSLNHSNSDTILQELSKCLMHGTEGSLLLLQGCLEFLDIYDKDLENMKLSPIYASILKLIMEKPCFTTVICESLRSVVINEDFLQKFCSALQFSGAEKIGVGLALSNSENCDIRLHGKNFCIGQIVDLCTNSVNFEKCDLIQDILLFLKRSEGLCMHVESFIQMLSVVKLDAENFTLAPLVSDEFREYNFWRNLDFSNEGDEDDFDAILAEMEEEISMADVMAELGYGCTVNASQCTEILSLFLPLSDSKISKIVGTLCQTCSGLDDSQNMYATFFSAMSGENYVDLAPLSSWNVDVLVDAIHQLAPGTNWINIVENLDHEGFYIPNEMAFYFLMSVFRCACKDPFPLHAIFGSIWKNVEGQLSFLKHAVSVPPEIFTFAHSSRKVSFDGAFLGYEIQTIQMHDAWLCLDLLEILCQLFELGHANVVRSILERPLGKCPEVLLIGMAHVNTSYNLMQNEVAATVIPQALMKTMENRFIFTLWHANSDLLCTGIVEAMNIDPECMFRILNACQELRIFSSVLDKIPWYFGIRLAILACNKDALDLENWLRSNPITNGDAFYKECLKFAKDFHSGPGIHFQPHGSVQNALSDACTTILKVLHSHTGTVFSSSLIEETEKICVPNMQTDSNIKIGRSHDCSEDIEAESNSYLHQMFSGLLSIEEMIQILTCFKESSEKRKQLIFDRMIANLFEEYQFFSKYPERQLKFAAILFGSLIKYKLVTHLTLGIALRAVLDALRKPTDSKIFNFGIISFEQFLDRLEEWPQYCKHILRISHFRDAYSNLVTMIEMALNKRPGSLNEHDVPNLTSDTYQVPLQSSTNVEVSSSFQPSLRVPVNLEETRGPMPPSNYLRPTQSSAEQPAPPPSSDTSATQKLPIGTGVESVPSATTGPPRSSIATSARFGSALNIEILVAAAERRGTPIEAPSSDIQDKISFIINNLSDSNVEAKAREFSDILNEQYYVWFAQYMVMKRASIETNFHDLYLKFLDKLNIKHLIKQIVLATYENCKVLLASELIKSSVEERSLLKNLGSWLGKVTIGRNTVLLALEIDPKPLIVEAYEKGLMIAVIPFTSKILESCSASIAYCPPNPWTMGILGLLAEIYAMPNLKMNLKFEIEVLFINLSVDLKDIAPSSLLIDRVREVEGNPDFSNKDVGIPQTPVVSEVKCGVIAQSNEVELPVEPAAPLQTGGHSRMMSQLVEDEKLAGVGLSYQLPASYSLLRGQVSVNQLPVPSANIEQQVVLNEKIQAYGLHMRLQSVLPIAMDRAVKEIVSNIVQRTVSIATQTTKELVLKDYALELDETLIRSAGNLMVARLAGSLAHVTCKEQLRIQISKHLRNLLQGTSSDLLDSAVQTVTYDNLDVGCVLIEHAATKKAVQTIDGEITQKLAIRRKLRESARTTMFDPSFYAPDALHPRALTNSQKRVYEDFARFPGQNCSSQSPNIARGGPYAPSSNYHISQEFISAPSGLVGKNIYPSNAVNCTNLDVPETSEIAFDEMNSAGVQIPASASSFHKAISDNSQSHETGSIVLFPPSTQFREAGSIAQPIITTLTSENPASNVSEALLTTGDALEKYQSISDKMENLLVNNAKESEIQEVVSNVPAVILRCISRDEAALAVAQRAFKSLFENAPKKAHVGAHLSVLATIRDVSKLIVKEITSWVIYSAEDRKFNRDIIVGLIQRDLLSLAEYNLYMAKLIDAGRNKAATDFAISLIEELLESNPEVITELHNLVDALAKFSARSGSLDSLQQLLEIAKNPLRIGASCPVAVGKEENTKTSRDRKAAGISGTSWEDSSVAESVDLDLDMQDKVSVLFGEWYQICEISGASDVACARYVSVLQQRNLLNGDDTSDRFFHIILELSVSHCLSSHLHQGPHLSFLAIDIFANLVFSVLKFHSVEQGQCKLSLLPKVLNIVVKFIQKDSEDKRESFNPTPYFRIFFNWILDLPSLDDPLSEVANLQVLTALANSLYALQPLKVPGFCFAWLELVSHRKFMPKLLTANAQKGWPYFQKLLIALLQFMEPFLRNSELTEPVHFLYKGTLRVLLVLLHDFPEFLCEYHFSFCDVIPPRCIQLRNIILVAFPRTIRFPDPSSSNLKIDQLSEMALPSRILSEVDAALKAKQIKNDVDEYLKTGQPGSSFLVDLKQKLMLSPVEATITGTPYDAPLINSLVLYIGMHAIQQQRARATSHLLPNIESLLSNTSLDIFQTLIIDLDSEGRYFLLNAIANQLRFPNNHTFYFTFLLLYLFLNANPKQEIIQEQIIRVVLERHMVKKPHPWGIIFTSLELIKNGIYGLWSKSFIRGVSEIEKMIESIVRSYGLQKATDDRVVSTSI